MFSIHFYKLDVSYVIQHTFSKVTVNWRKWRDYIFKNTRGLEMRLILYLFYRKKGKIIYLAFADLSIYFSYKVSTVACNASRLSCQKVNLHNTLVTWAWGACAWTLSKFSGSAPGCNRLWGVIARYYQTSKDRTALTVLQMTRAITSEKEPVQPRSASHGD